MSHFGHSGNESWDSYFTLWMSRTQNPWPATGPSPVISQFSLRRNSLVDCFVNRVYDPECPLSSENCWASPLPQRRGQLFLVDTLLVFGVWRVRCFSWGLAGWCVIVQGPVRGNSGLENTLLHHTSDFFKNDSTSTEKFERNNNKIFHTRISHSLVNFAGLKFEVRL